MNSSKKEGKRKFTKNLTHLQVRMAIFNNPQELLQHSLSGRRIGLESCSAKFCIMLCCLCYLHNRPGTIVLHILFIKLYEPCKTKQGTGVGDALAVLNVVLG
jgi:hypothetical protein